MEAHPQQLATLLADPPTAAKVAGLRYVMDDGPGIRRQRAGRGVSLHRLGRQANPRPTGVAAHSSAGDTARLDGDVDQPHPARHLQATGRDEKGRKQYRYHPRWRAGRDEAKFGQMD